MSGAEAPAPLGRGRRIVLLAAVFVVAACGLVYELVAGAVSAYLQGDAVTQYSLVIGTFMCAMGLGSWLARFVTTHLLERLVQVELLLALVGGLSSLTTFAVGAWLSPWFGVAFYGQAIVIGTLVGLEIPILVRLLKEEGELTGALSDALALDYVGALLGAVAFPLLALPLLGLSRSSLVFGLMNAVVAGGLSLLLKARTGPLLAVAAVVGVLGTAFVASDRVVRMVEDRLYQDDIVYTEQSPYQRLVVTRWRDDVRLYLDGHLQFSTTDEARYHEALLVPVLAATRPRRVLVLGGGDGLALRRILSHPDVEHVDLVDLDPAVTTWASTFAPMVELNGGAFDDPRVTVHHTDAFVFVEETAETWDAIVADLPDPHSATLARLYTTAFYALLARRLTPQGALVTQATSPFYAPEAFWTIAATVARSVPADHPLGPLRVHPYHLHVPSFGEWGFVLAARRDLDVSALAPTIDTAVLTPESTAALFVFDKALGDRSQARVNTLDDPNLAESYLRGWRRYNE